MRRIFTLCNNFRFSGFLFKNPLILLSLILCPTLHSFAQNKASKPHDFYKNVKAEDFVFYGGDTLKDFDLHGTFEKAKAMNCSSNELRIYMLRQERFFLFSKYRSVLKNSRTHDPLRLISRYGEENESSAAEKTKGMESKKLQDISSKKETTTHRTLASGCNNLDFSDPAPYTNWTAAYGENDWQGAGSVFGTFADWQVSTATLNTQNTTPPPAGHPITQGENAGLNSCSWVTICTHGTDSCGGFPMVCPGFTASCRLGGDFVNLQPGIGGGFSGCGSYGDSAFDAGLGVDTSSGTEDLVTGSVTGGLREYGAQGEEIEQSIPITSANALLNINYAVVLNDGGHPAGQEPFVFFTVYDQFGNTIPCLQYYQEAVSGTFPPGFSLGKSINWIQNTVANGGGEYQTDCYYKPWSSVSFDMSAYIGTTVTFQAIACGCWPGGHFAYCYVDISCGQVQMTSTPTCGSTSITSLPGATSYSWSGPCISGPSTNQTVDVSCSGTYSCTINLNGTPGCNFVVDTAITVTVNPIISASATSPTICSGNSTTINASGAGAGGTYTWSPGTGLSATTGASVTATPSVTTTYTVTGSTSPLTCSGTKTVVVTVNATPTVTVSASAPTICSGNSTTLSASGATTYTWTPNTALSATTGSPITATPGSTITYTVNGTSSGCAGTSKTVVVTVNPTPTITASASSPTICSGNSTTLTAGGATTYTWTPNTALSASTGSPITATPGSSITYTVTGTTAGCTSSAQTVVVTVNAAPTITASASSPTICSGNSTTLTAGGATTYTWTPNTALSATTGSPITASPGSTVTYTVNGSSSGCPGVPKTVVVTVNPIPTITVSTLSPSICSGNSTTLTASGATTYTWTPNTALSASTGSPVTATPGSSITYTVTGTTAGCTSSAQTVAVTVNPTPTITVSASLPTICSGNSTTLTAVGAATYTWTPNTALSATTGSPIIATPGSSITYTVTGTTGGCTGAPQTVVIAVTPTPTITASASSPTICSGNSTTLTASGATTYTWTPNTALSASTGSPVIATPSSSITYTITGTTSGCTSAAQTVAVTVNATPTITVAPLSPTICSGGNVILTASGASAYLWNTGATTSSINVAPASTTTYTVNGSSSGCPSAPATVVVTVSSALNVTVTPGVPSICTGSNIVLNAGGAAAYTWKPGTGLSCTNCSNPTANPASTVTYTVVGTSGSCSDSATVILTVNTTPTIIASAISPTICSGNSTTLNASGAVTYTWTPNTALSASTGASVTAAPTTTITYTVTGTNASGCSSAPQTVIIAVNPTPTLSILPVGPVICSGNSVAVTASGATTYSWSPSTGLSCSTCANPTANPLVTTTYTLVGTNPGGCTDSSVYIVTVTPTPTIAVTPNSPGICPGDSVVLTASGATTYSWNSGQTTDTIDVHPASTTTYTVTGLNGACSSQAIVTVAVGTLTVTATASNPTICSGSSSILSATGASTYTWSTGATTASVNVSPVVSTTYMVTGKSGSGCNSTATVVVNVNPTPTITAASSLPSVCNSATTSAFATFSGGGTAPYTYAWSSGQTTDTANGLGAGTYTVNVTDANGCVSDTATVTINANTITVSAIAASPSICTGSSTQLTASGATNYTWTPSASLTNTNSDTTTASPAITTTYSVTGTSGSCADSTTVVVTINPTPVISASATDTNICAGNSTTLTASGASTYSWQPGSLSGTPISVSPAVSTTYTVSGTTAAGCSGTAVVAITINPTPTLTISMSSGNDTICTGQSITLTANGTSGSYLWSNGATTSTITVSPASTTSYYVIGSNGPCADTSVAQSIYLYPPLVVTMKSDSSCTGKNAALTVIASGGEPGYTYSWSNGTTGTNTISVSPSSSTFYTCTVTDGCGNKDVDSAEIFVFPLSKVAFESTPDTILGGQYVSFTNQTVGATGFWWTFGDGASSSDTNPYHQYSASGAYIVTLIATNNICHDTVTDTVYVIETIYIPNVFTPNGDGLNDVFHVSAGGMRTYHIEIFNRWGERVFQSNSPGIDWDGESSAGVKESDGTYYYILTATDYSGKNYNFDGYLQLIR